MPIYARRPRFGRILDVVVVTLLFAVFAGLAVYHYRRLDRDNENPELVNELVGRSFDKQKKTGDEKQAVTSSHDWPQWRGPHRDGISTEMIRTDWPTDGPTRLWEAKVGEGFSSVAVANGRVYTIFQAGANENVVCWDAETGKEIWRFCYPCYFKNSYGSGPRSTPTVDGDLVYTVGGTGLMHCLKVTSKDHHGEVVWQKDLMKEFGADIPTWGIALSPLVEGDRVFILPGGPRGNSLVALDKRTGAILWKKGDDPAGYSSPIAATIHDRRQILFLTGSRLASVDPETGNQLWDYPWEVQQQVNVATPIVEPPYVFISSGYGKGCAMLKIDKTGDEWKARFVYKNRHMRNHFSTCVRHKDYLYGFDDATLVCMDFRTGKVKWDESGFDKGSVLLVSDHLIVYGANGLLAVAEANPTEYVEKASFRFSSQKSSCWSVPVVSNGRLYVRDQEKLVCFDVKVAK